jgi:hypothetical protein
VSDSGYSLYQPDSPHENVLDALAEHCGVQWGLHRPVAEAIVNHFMQPTPVLEIPAAPESTPEEKHEQTT